MSHKRIVWSYTSTAVVLAAAALIGFSAFPLTGEPQSSAAHDQLLGTLDRIDVSRLPEPVRSQLDARLNEFRGAPYSNALMRQIEAAISPMDSKLVYLWQRDEPGRFSLTLSYDMPRVTSPLPEFPDSGEKRLRIGGNVQALKIVHKEPVSYPIGAKIAKVSGTVQVAILVGKDGRVANVQTLSGSALLAPAAEEAVMRWRYQPTWLNGEPVEVVSTVDVNFTLLD